jgi:ribose-phosphate pyrophosphokinase
MRRCVIPLAVGLSGLSMAAMESPKVAVGQPEKVGHHVAHNSVPNTQRVAVPTPSEKKIVAPVIESVSRKKGSEDPDISIISGTANRPLSDKIALTLGRDLSDVDIKQFADGEISIVINESMRGKDVFILQTCASPVNDSVMELLLSVAAAKRSGANSVTAIIPYFGYKLNRRGLPISTTHHSRFLWSAASDLAKMLLVMGVDKVISVDLQRPGQGHEACFFHQSLPAETITTHDLFTEYFHKTLSNDTPLVIVSPNTELVKKAKKFQSKLSQLRPSQEIECAAFLRSDSDLSYVKGAPLELQGDVRGKDVVLIEDYIDSAVHICILCNRLLKEGAKHVYVAASHGHFDAKSINIFNLSPITQVIVSDSIPLPANITVAHGKVVQLSIAPLIANIIQSDSKYSIVEFNPDNEEDQFVME